MRQNSTLKSSNSVRLQNAPKKELLHPVLGSALAHLDIQLEQELARYRRLRSGNRATPRQTGRKQPPKAPDLITISAKRDSSPSQQPTNPTPEAWSDHSRGDRSSSSGSNPLPQNSVNPSSASVASLSGSLTAKVMEPDLANNAEDCVDDLLSTGAAREILTEAEKELELDDYLESSEELLRSLADEEAQVQVERGFMKSLLTPLGVGSMLLLLLSSSMLGYVIMNPSSLNRLLAFRGSNTTSPVASNRQPDTGAAPSTSSSQRPNLASQEFTDLNLGNLGTLDPTSSKLSPGSAGASQPNSKKSVSGSTKAGAKGKSANLATPNIGAGRSSSSVASPSESSRVAPVTSAPSGSSGGAQSYAPARPAVPNYPQTAPRRASVRSSPAAAAYSQPSPAPVVLRSPASQAATSGGYPFKVQTDYVGDPSLEAAKKVVPDAYVRNSQDNGAKIQLGAFPSAAEAEAKAQELRKQGISAEVQKN